VNFKPRGYGAGPVGHKVVQAPQYFQRDRVTGYLYQGSLNIEQQLGNQLLLTLGYLGTFGHHLSATNNENTNQVTPANMALLPTTKNTQTLRPYPQFGNVSLTPPPVPKTPPLRSATLPALLVEVLDC
jgi:hypothetical protein